MDSWREGALRTIEGDIQDPIKPPQREARAIRYIPSILYILYTLCTFVTLSTFYFIIHQDHMCIYNYRTITALEYNNYKVLQVLSALYPQLLLIVDKLSIVCYNVRMDNSFWVPLRRI